MTTGLKREATDVTRNVDAWSSGLDRLHRESACPDRRDPAFVSFVGFRSAYAQYVKDVAYWQATRWKGAAK